jgi:hypothetical protein
MSNNLSNDMKTAAVSMPCEGNGIRSIEGMTGVRRDTSMRLGVRLGEGQAAGEVPLSGMQSFQPSASCLRMPWDGARNV